MHRLVETNCAAVLALDSSQGMASMHAYAPEHTPLESAGFLMLIIENLRGQYAYEYEGENRNKNAYQCCTARYPQIEQM